MKQDMNLCWDFFKCPEDIKVACEVYRNEMGDKCWLLSDLKKGCGCSASKEHNGCLKCDFFKKFNPL